jgi:hypothetical protein
VRAPASNREEHHLGYPVCPLSEQGPRGRSPQMRGRDREGLGRGPMSMYTLRLLSVKGIVGAPSCKERRRYRKQGKEESLVPPGTQSTGNVKRGKTVERRAGRSGGKTSEERNPMSVHGVKQSREGYGRKKASRARERPKAQHSRVRQTRCWSLPVASCAVGARDPMRGGSARSGPRREDLEVPRKVTRGYGYGHCASYPT